jgi:hypothetical protein
MGGQTAREGSLANWVAIVRCEHSPVPSSPKMWLMNLKTNVTNTIDNLITNKIVEVSSKSAIIFGSEPRVMTTGTTSESLEKDLTSLDVLRAALSAGAYDFWDNPCEDVYSLQDGEPI